MTEVKYAGDPDPLHDMGMYSYTNGATYDETTHRLYVLAGAAYTTVHVYEFDDTPADGTDDPGGNPATGFATLLKQVLALIVALIERLLALFA
jgi:hypothetical protein